METCNLFFLILGAAIVASGIIKCQTVSMKLGDFLIQYCGFVIQLLAQRKKLTF